MKIHENNNQPKKWNSFDKSLIKYLFFRWSQHVVYIFCINYMTNLVSIFLCFTLRKKFPYSEFFWSVFFRIRTEYGEKLGISPHSVRMWKNTDQKTPNTDTFYAVPGLTISASFRNNTKCLTTFWQLNKTRNLYRILQNRSYSFEIRLVFWGHKE